ncbi:hypothetical protein [Methanoculleus horonobensis]|uniref:hypothetical protein n=1 Tax=Methanoculleus horonobensis TaxID=528314 RepID=UPI000835221E|nr:hypothetical protein [Methanoculleus horonobensis]MDD3071083.1 nucleotidyltransferase domain-containing protein [Methanoculleus horonobensis]MDD4252870.1 nucleotidyltransferase domain-containing protein [Methanoculleus horonobensis]
MHRACGRDLQCRAAIAPRVKKQIRDPAHETRSRRRLSAVILYGSFARGDFRERHHKRAATTLDLTDLPVEPLCYTDETFAERVLSANPFVLQAPDEGIRLWARLTCRPPASRSVRP